MPREARSIPMGLYHAEPVIVENVETVQYYEVNGEKFFDGTIALRKAKRLKEEMSEHTDDVIVYSIGDERFLDREKAEKRLRVLTREYRKKVRNTVRVYGVEKASQGNLLPHMVWLITHYSLDELKNAHFLWAFNEDKEALIRQEFADFVNRFVNNADTLPNPLDMTQPLEYFFENEPFSRMLNYLSAYGALTKFNVDADISRMNGDVFRTTSGKPSRTWSWLEPYEELDGFFRVPVHYGFKFGTPAFRAWIDENGALGDKIYKVAELVNYRVGELLYREALALTTIDEDNVMTVPSLDEVLFNAPCDLLLDELKKIIEFIDGNENGTNFHIAVQKGVPVYWLNDDKRNLSPFKQF